MKKPPQSPDPTATANTQQQYNIGGAQAQQETNMVNQNTPFGSLAYSQTGVNPDGTPKFSANQSYTPQVQGTIDQLLGKANSQAGTDTIGTQMGLYSQYMQPLIDQQQRKLNDQLQTQGITQGGDQQAFNNAQNLNARNVADQRSNWLINSIGAANQVQMQPYNELNALRTGANPGFGNTPTAQIQPANYMGQVQSNYQNQMGAANAWNTGLFGLGSAAIGGLARGFGGGMFGGGGDGSSISTDPYGSGGQYYGRP